MTLDFQCLSLSHSRHGMGKSFVTGFITLLLFFSDVAGSHAMHGYRDLDQRLLWENGCLLIDDGMLPAQRTLDPGNNSTEIEYDVFPLERSIKQVAEKIVAGMIASWRNDAGERAIGDSLVDLGVLIRQQVQLSTIQRDPYWNYYSSCDRWDVVFNAEPQFLQPDEFVSTENSADIENQAEKKHVITQLKQFYLSLEFLFVEQIRIRQFVQPFDSPLVTDCSAWSPYSLWVSIRQNPFFGLWANLNERIETASRLIFELKYTANYENRLPRPLLPLH